MWKKWLFSLLLFTISFLGSKAQIGRFSLEQPVYHKGDTIHGTLLTSLDVFKEQDFQSQPLVIIIPGSGPTDRNGNSGMAMSPGKNNSYLQLADSLLKEGIASYRYDKPGVGASVTHRKEEDMRFEDNIDIVKAILAKMQEIGFRDIYLLGHSEGSLIGILTAQQAEEVQGLISIAGASENIADVLEVQIRENVPESLRDQALEKLDSLEKGHMVNKYNMLLVSLFRKSVQPYLMSWMAYTPSAEIAGLTIPVLVIQGGRDLQVAERNGETLSLSAKNSTYLYYPEMNHIMKMVDDSPEQNKAAYMDEDFPLQEGIAEDIRDWMDKI